MESARQTCTLPNYNYFNYHDTADAGPASYEISDSMTSHTSCTPTVASFAAYWLSVNPNNTSITIEPHPPTGAKLDGGLPPPTDFPHVSAPPGERFNPQYYPKDATGYHESTYIAPAPSSGSPSCATERSNSPRTSPEYFIHALELCRSHNDDNCWMSPATHQTGGWQHRVHGGAGYPLSLPSCQLRVYSEKSTSHRSNRTQPYSFKARDRPGVARDAGGQKIEAAQESVTTIGGSQECQHLFLTFDIYNWMFAVLYPKRRNDKTVPTPSGQCRLCNAYCKRSGILRQHVVIIHRQRIARKVVIGQRYCAELALAFVVAQLESDMCSDSAASIEVGAFKKHLAANLTGLAPTSVENYPALLGKLVEFCNDNSWVGVKCNGCGTWLTRPVALADHASLCTKPLEANPDSNATSPTEPPLRLTAKGLAARPTRVINHQHRKCSPTPSAA